MTSQVVTSFSPAGERLYGRRMVEAFARYWPASTELVVYADAQTRLPSGTVRLTTELPDWMACRQRWDRDPVVQGQSTPEVPRSKPYAYRFDARRFAVKVFVICDAAERLGTGILTWLDGDTVTTAPIPDDLPARWLGDADVAYLGRGPMHPETGYLGFRIPAALPLLRWCREQYVSDAFRTMTDGWTDCHIIRAGLAAVPVMARDLTGHRYEGVSHIWPASPLSPYMAHHKGARKRKAAA